MPLQAAKAADALASSAVASVVSEELVQLTIDTIHRWIEAWGGSDAVRKTFLNRRGFLEVESNRCVCACRL